MAKSTLAIQVNVPVNSSAGVALPSGSIFIPEQFNTANLMNFNEDGSLADGTVSAELFNSFANKADYEAGKERIGINDADGNRINNGTIVLTPEEINAANLPTTIYTKFLEFIAVKLDTASSNLALVIVTK